MTNPESPKNPESPIAKEIAALKSEVEGSYKWVKLQYDEPYKNIRTKEGKIIENHLSKTNHKVIFDGHTETYYTTKDGFKITNTAYGTPPGVHIAKDGTVRDKDWYIVVAINKNKSKSLGLGKHARIMSSIWPCKVYDSWSGVQWLDIFTNRPSLTKKRRS